MSGFGYHVLGFGAHPSRGDATPNAFSFTDVTGRALNTAITSNTLTIAGMDDGTDISIASSGTGGTHLYKINSGSFTASAGTVDSGDTVTLKVTTAALLLGSLTNVSITIGTTTDVWKVTTIAPAPALANPTLVMGLSAQLFGSGGSASLTTVGVNYNTNNRNALLALDGATGGDNNNLVATGGTNNLTLAPNTGMHLQVGGTYTNHMYHPSEYETTLTINCSVAPDLDPGAGGDDNAQGNTLFHLNSDNNATGPVNQVLSTGWNLNTSAITSNSQAVLFNLFALNQLGVTTLQAVESARVGIRHAGHPGASSSTFYMAAFAIIVKITRISDSSVIHNNIEILPNTLLNFLPA